MSAGMPIQSTLLMSYKVGGSHIGWVFRWVGGSDVGWAIWLVGGWLIWRVGGSDGGWDSLLMGEWLRRGGGPVGW